MKLSMLTRITGSFALVMLLTGGLHAQDKRWEEGEIESVEIEIVKERQISLPPANRNFEKIPPQPSEPIRSPFQYEFRPFTFQTAQINPAIRPLRLKQEDAQNLFGGYVSAGFGNYVSPYLEAFVNTRKDKNKLVGAHAFLNSSDRGPVDGRNSGSGTAGVSVFGRTFTESVSVGGELEFENRSTHFYGYPEGLDVDASDIKQAFNYFKLSADLASAKKTNFSYKLGGLFSYLDDRFEAAESEVDLSLDLNYKIGDQSSVAIDADYAAIARKDVAVEPETRSLFTVNPSFVFYPIENLKMSAGIVAAFENDSIDDKNLHAYPDIHISYPLSPSVDVVGSLTGGIEKVSLQSLSRENLWLAPNVPVFHTNKLYDLQAALHTRVGSKVAVNGGFSFANLKNWYFFVNNATSLDPVFGQSTFTTDYEDDGTLRTNFFASIGFAQTESFKVLVRADVYQYDRDQGEVWHRPTYRVTGDLSFNLYKKILFDVNLISQGGMKAFVSDTEETVRIDPAFDLNARVEYLLSERASIFAQFNNITSNEYQVFLNYPVRGFQALGGLTYSF